MQEQFNEKISLLIDDQLGKDQALALLRKLHGDEELKSKLQRYQVLSLVLKHQQCPPPHNGLADKIRQQIQHEPSFLLPARKPAIRAVNWRRTSLAVAASIMLAMIWAANKIEKPDTAYGQAQFALALPLPSQQQLRHDPVDDHFNDLLQAHDNSVYVNHVRQAQPYARVVGFQQE
ncbi:MAG: sigma-E factor negative regulatory protein [Methylococcales bacterium]|nr:sigma-E factor negative regulatory protein [Methylococcales bacterium]